MKKRRLREIKKLDEINKPIDSILIVDDNREWLFLVSTQDVPSSKRVIWWKNIAGKERVTKSDIKNWQSTIEFAHTEWKGRL